VAVGRAKGRALAVVATGAAVVELVAVLVVRHGEGTVGPLGGVARVDLASELRVGREAQPHPKQLAHGGEQPVGELGEQRVAHDEGVGGGGGLEEERGDAHAPGEG
jgi:hypothetical protein